MFQLGKLFLTPVIIWMTNFTSTFSRDLSIPVSASLREALLPFTNLKFLEKPTSFRPLVPSLDILTDASDSGWSGVIGRHRAQDCWTPSELSNHINVKEMLGILYSIQFFRDVLSDRTIRILKDNMVALFCLRRLGSLHSPPLDRVTRQLILFCHQRNISFVPVHIQGKMNVLADQGSRLEPLATEWMLDPDLFGSICQRIFPFPQVDLFASRATARLSYYISPCADPEAYRVDDMDRFKLE